MNTIIQLIIPFNTFLILYLLFRTRRHLNANSVSNSDEPPGEEEIAPALRARLTPLELSEREVIQKFLAKNDSNKSRTSKELGISVNTLNARIKKYGILESQSSEEDSNIVFIKRENPVPKFSLRSGEDEESSKILYHP